MTKDFNPETAPEKERCPSCGEECELDEIRGCPCCERAGCDYCMPVKEYQCPECEDEEGA